MTSLRRPPPGCAQSAGDRPEPVARHARSGHSDFGVIGYAQRDRARRSRGQLLLMPALASHFLAMSDRLVPLAASAFIVIRSSVVSFAETAFSVLVMVSFCLPDLISGTTFSAANRFLSSSRATRWLECRPGSVLKRSPAWIWPLVSAVIV